MKITMFWSFAIICLGVLLNPASSSFLHQIVNGSLTDSFRFNFSIQTKDFKGIILYCIDSKGNPFVIEVKGKSNVKHINLKYNKIIKSVLLKTLCGCDPCGDKRMIFYIQLKKFQKMKVKCNNIHTSKEFSFQKNDINKYDNVDNHVYPLPLSIVNISQKMYIMIGNIGPYVGEGNIKVAPIREQMIGCLESFYYNDNQIIFIQKGTQVQPLCPEKCNNNTCNGGVCMESIAASGTIICNCSSVALNGPYCNRSLTKYNKGGHNSYKKMKEAKNVYLKMTWRQNLTKRYCLMEILGTRDLFLLSTENGNIIINNTSISQLNIEGINFIIINITNNYLIIKIKDKELKRNIALDEKTKINIGFSESNKNIELFDGEYDLNYNFTELRKETQIQSKDWTTSEIMTTEETFKMKIITLSCIPVGCLAILTIIFLILYQRIRNKIKNESSSSRMSVQGSFALNQSDATFTETEVYGKVNDDSDYIYDVTEDVYTIVNI